MTSLPSVLVLKQAVQLAEQIEALQQRLYSILAGQSSEEVRPAKKKRRRRKSRRKMSSKRTPKSTEAGKDDTNNDMASEGRRAET